MAQKNESFTQYVEALLECENFTEAFSVFEAEVIRLGFEGVLYTYIPQVLIDIGAKPVYEVSSSYAPEYLVHYSEARFDQRDPLIAAVQNGETDPISWWGRLCNRYIDSRASREVLETSLDYGINNGITLPLLSGPQGLAGASFISSDKNRTFAVLLEEQLIELQRYTRLFHNMVVAKSLFKGRFSKPLFDTLSDTEVQLLAGLARGQSMAQVSTNINRSVKYLEQVMLTLRRKLSGVEDGSTPTINRNQLLYCAGVMNFLDYVDYDGKGVVHRRS